MTDVTLRAGETTYNLDLGVSGICDLEAAFGDKGLFEIMSLFADGKKARLGEFRKFIAVLLRDPAGKKLDEATAFAAIDHAGISASVAAVAAAITQILARAQGEAQGEA